ncbi:flavin reductase family protein [Streptomyces anulatus]
MKGLRRAFAEFATGVTVVTVGGSSPRGMTANSFTSVSMRPPLLLVCVHNDAVMRQALHPARHFGVSVRRRGSHDSRRHGGRPEPAADGGRGVHGSGNGRGRSAVLPRPVPGARPRGRGAVPVRRVPGRGVS